MARNELKLSEQCVKNIEAKIEDLIKAMRHEMEIASIDHFELSLDLNFDNIGKFAGVKYSAFKFERMKKVYDTDIEK